MPELSPDATAFAVRATPDDGNRRSRTMPWDETTRPEYHAPDPDRKYTAHEQATARHLVQVHDQLRAELAQLGELVDQVASGEGEVDTDTARAAINAMALRQNNWTLGSYCQTYCRVVTTHHTIEDVGVFPHLRSRDVALAPVLDRLEQEHHVIAEVLNALDGALVGLVSEPDRIDAVREAVDTLTDTMLSHLSYEERMLLEPLARYSFY